MYVTFRVPLNIYQKKGIKKIRIFTVMLNKIRQLRAYTHNVFLVVAISK